MKKNQHSLGVLRTLCNRTSMFLMGFGIATVVFAGLSGSAAAATPPDNCFAFSGNTILEYYNNEDNNISNPTCTKNVDIPATIGGQPVTTIADLAFAGKDITAVTFPASLTTIGEYAFQNDDLTALVLPDTITTVGVRAFVGNQLSSLTLSNSLTTINERVFADNQLTSLTIPDSVTTIGSNAFFNNKLTTVDLGNSVTDIELAAFAYNSIVAITLPDSVTTLGQYVFISQGPWTGIDIEAELTSGDPARVQAIYDEIWYARVYTETPSNPNNLADQLMIEAATGTDANANSKLTDSLGGHLINPARAIISYQDSEGNTLAASTIHTGATQASYMAIVNTYNDFSLYYRMGDSDTFSPLAISGYTAPANHTLDLTDADNPYTFVYTTASNPTDDNTDNTPSDSNNTSDDSLAESGDTRMTSITLLAIVGMCMTGYIIRHARRNYRHV